MSGSQTGKKLVSIVTPCFNEEKSLEDCYQTIKGIFSSQLSRYNYEHIFCDNCSTDSSPQILRRLAQNDPRVKVIINSRNFGILKNTYNGVMSTQGDAAFLFVPVDLQDPPELMPDFIKKWEEGYEIVYGIRAERQENFVLANARKAYYRLLSSLTYVDYPPNVGDYQLVDRKVLNAMRKVEDAQPFMRLMTFDCGFRSIGISYTWRARKVGKSRNSMANLFEQALNGLVAYSGAPIRLSLISGFVIAACSIIYAAAILILTLIGVITSPVGIPTIVIALFFFGGVQLFFLGVIGEYVFAIFNQVRKKPIVFERERINF